MSSIDDNKMGGTPIPAATMDGDSVKMESHSVEQSAEAQPKRSSGEDAVASRVTLKLVLLVTACVSSNTLLYFIKCADDAQTLSDCFLSSSRTISSSMIAWMRMLTADHFRTTRSLRQRFLESPTNSILSTMLG